ncbi:MAG: hypothetical protein JWM99_1116 [Verrucomicrobiales bacterium]|nr:hypothetical protein [Verrucomicrobiales bacterium]
MSIIAFFIIGLAVLDALATQAQDLSPSAEWGPFVEPDFPFFTSTLDTRKPGRRGPSDNLTPRGLILNLGHNCWACFDTDLLRISALWIGTGVTPVSMSQISYHSPGTKTVEGEDHLPQIIGTPWLKTGIYAGWQIGTEISLSDPREAGPDPKEIGRGPLPVALGRFNALRLTERGMRLEYQVGNVQVIETVEAILQQDQPFIQRSFHLERRETDLTLVVGEKAASTQDEINLELSTQPNSLSSLVEKVPRQDGIVVVHVKPSEQALDFQLAIGFGKIKTWEKTDQTPASPLRKPRWPQKLKTRAILSSTVDAYVSDNIPLPVQNPWHRNIRLADIAFFHEGRAAAVTFDGDVWMIEGLSGDLQNVQWHRFASGLQEPMGLCVRDDELFVCDRNGIWRLRDTDKNGEADIYEMFSNAYTQTAETREYAQGIRAAPDGSFVIAKGGSKCPHWENTMALYCASPRTADPVPSLVTDFALRLSA